MLKGRTFNAALAAVTAGMALGFCVTAAVAASAAPAAAAHARAAAAASTAPVSQQLMAMSPSAGTRCTYGSSGVNVRTCFTVTGSRQYVQSMSASLCVGHFAQTLHLQIIGPGIDSNSVQLVFSPGDCPSLSWYIPVSRNVAAGVYSAIAWRYNGGKSYSSVGEVTFVVY